MNAGFKIPTRIDAEPAERRFDLRAYLNFVWRHWMFIGAVTALALVWRVIYLVRATPLYTATTQVLLEQREKAPGLDTGSSDYPLRQSFVHRKPACNPQIRLAAAEGCYQGAARTAATDCQGAADAQMPPKRIRHRRKPSSSWMA